MDKLSVGREEYLEKLRNGDVKFLNRGRKITLGDPQGKMGRE